MPYGAPQPGDASYQGASVPPPPAQGYQGDNQASLQAGLHQPTVPAPSYGAAAQYYNSSLEPHPQQKYGRPEYESGETHSSRSRSLEEKQYPASEAQTEPLRPKRSGRSQRSRNQEPSRRMEETQPHNLDSSSYEVSGRVG